MEQLDPLEPPELDLTNFPTKWEQLLENPLNPFYHEPNPEIAVFHDESGTYKTDEWVLTGLLWIRRRHISDLVEQLRKARGNYGGELHFHKFPKSFEGIYGSAPRAARLWFELWRDEWLYRTWLHVLAIRRKRLRPTSFPYDFHKYNRFTAMAIKAALSWHFNTCESLQLYFYSDQKIRRPEGTVGDGVKTDNFESYVRKILRDYSFDRQKVFKGPNVELRELRCLDSKSNNGTFLPEEELLQLTDILLGSVSTAISAKSQRETKLWFGCEMAKLMEDARQPQGGELLGAEHFSVTYFPDENGKIYNDEPILLITNSNTDYFKG